MDGRHEKISSKSQRKNGGSDMQTPKPGVRMLNKSAIVRMFISPYKYSSVEAESGVRMLNSFGVLRCPHV